jgi:hypothetical protein
MGHNPNEKKLKISKKLTNDNSDQVGGHDGRRLEGDGL